jgi:hypothetical protein
VNKRITVGLFLDLASELRVRSEKYGISSKVVVAAAFWEGRRMKHCNYGPD